MDRRTILRAAGVALGAGLAGCAADGTGGDGENPDGTPTGTPTTATDGGVAVTDTRVAQYTVRSGLPDWYEAGEPGRVVVVDSAERQRAVVDAAAVPDERAAAVEALLDEVDYGRERVLLVESGGPDTCHDEVSVSELAITDGRLTGRARAVNTAGPETACGDALTFPAALVRVAFDGQPPDTAALRVADGFGNEATVTASAADPVGPALADLDGHVRPDGEGATIAPLDCADDDFKRLPGDAFGSVAYGSVATDGDPQFGLRVEATAYDRGDPLVVRLTNVTDREAVTGNRHKYALQVRTEAGWQDVRGVTDGRASVGYTDEGIVHDPGEGFTWELPLTAEGVVPDDPATDDLVVCPGLPAGRYRFVYWGVGGDADADAVAVAFDIVD